jgi:hypothetical protein
VRDHQPEELFKRIDQEELEKLGVTHKSNIHIDSFEDLHQYSMTMRFRAGKDMKEPDSYKSKKRSVQNKENMGP